MKIKYNITGIDCPNCASKLEKEIAKNSDLASVKINFLSERLTVETDLSIESVDEYVKACAKSFSSTVEVHRI
jgi:copper chaperone CopZ